MSSQPTTPIYGWPYPAPGTKPPDVPYWDQRELEAIENTVKANAATRVQGNRQVVTTTGTGAFTIAYPVAFSGLPASIVLSDGDSSSTTILQIGLSHPSITAAQYSAYVRNQAGTVVASASVRIAWIAIGPA